jgi:hypothetical protein
MSANMAMNATSITILPAYTGTTGTTTAVKVVPPALDSIGGGESATAIVPANTCSLFGPNPPPPLPGQPPGRPVDPDPTGGYYQPVSVFVAPKSASVISTVYPSRIYCGFANVDPMSAGMLTSQYHFNSNPTVASLTVVGGQVLQPDPTTMTNDVAMGQHMQLEVAWPPSCGPSGGSACCPLTDVCGDGICGADESLMNCMADCMTPKGCGGAERFVNYDLATYSVVDQREGIHVAWYATGGAFDNDRTGRDGTDTITTSDNGWQAPSSPGKVYLWVVLSDDRGGIGWSGYTVTVH